MPITCHCCADRAPVAGAMHVRLSVLRYSAVHAVLPVLLPEARLDMLSQQPRRWAEQWSVAGSSYTALGTGVLAAEAPHRCAHVASDRIAMWK
jgi:hypothetical protein